MCKFLIRLFAKKHKVKTEEEISKAKAAAEEKLLHLQDAFYALSEDTVTLYDKIEDFFFQDIDFQMFQGAVSRWMADAGRSPESGMSRVSYDKYRQVYNDPISNRVLHWFDVQNIIGAFQDRLIATEGYMKEIFATIPAYCLYNDDEYTGATRDIGFSSDQIHI